MAVAELDFVGEIRVHTKAMGVRGKSMTARSAFSARLICLLILLPGCRDDVDNIVSSTEPDGGIIITPDRTDRGVRDAGGAADEGTPNLDGGDAAPQRIDAEGMLIRQDGGVDPVMDVGPGDPRDQGVDPPEAGPMMFPDHPLPPSQCGRFGPREALHANPARVESYRHSGPGEWFNEPALYGCTPARLLWEEGEDEARLWQRFDFEYEGIRAQASQWEFGEGGESAALGRTLEINEHGLVTRAAYRCEDGVTETDVRLRYDAQGRLIEYTRDGEMSCAALNAPLGVTIEYIYDGDETLPARFVVRIDIANVEVAHELTYTWEEDRIVRVDIRAQGMDDKYRLFTYDADGRIEREEIWRPDRDKADREITYGYDESGRLRSKRDSETGQYRFQYDESGNLGGVQWPNGETLIERGHPEWAAVDAVERP